MTRNPGRAIVALCLNVLLAGCAAAAAGAAGAATGIYLTSRGVGGVVEGSVDDVVRRTEAVYAEMGISIEEREVQREDGVYEVEVKGERDGMSVDTNITRVSATTSRVEVEAQESPVEWDQDYARAVLDRIVSRS